MPLGVPRVGAQNGHRQPHGTQEEEQVGVRETVSHKAPKAFAFTL